MLATKERIIADRSIATERYILSTMPLLYLPLWRSDGSSQFLSSDGHGHLCTVAGALWTPRGRKFNGVADKVDAGINAYDLGIRQHATFETWANVDDLINANNLISDWNVNIGIFLRAEQTNGIPTFAVYPNNHRITATGYAVAPRTWFHLVGVMDGANMYLYKDGSLIGTTTLGEDIGSSSVNINIGTRGDGVGFVKGSIGEVSIYNRALSAVEVQNHHLATRWRYQ